MMKDFQREIFEQLGHVFYAIAAEQDISVLASGELKMLFRKEWLVEKEERSKDKVPEPAHLMGLTVDALLRERVSASEAFTSFEAFYGTHEEQLSHTFKQMILDTVEMILKTFPREGKKNVYAERLTMMVQRSMERTASDG